MIKSLLRVTHNLYISIFFAVDPTTQITSLPSIHPISIKLDRTNYIFWKHMCLLLLVLFVLKMCFNQNSAPMQFSSSTSSKTPIPNPTHLVWLRRDQFIFSWILASILPAMIGYVGQCTSLAQLWSTFEVLFHSQSKARLMLLKF